MNMKSRKITDIKEEITAWKGRWEDKIKKKCIEIKKEYRRKTLLQKYKEKTNRLILSPKLHEHRHLAP